MQSTLHTRVQPLLRKALSKSHILSAERERELLLRYHADKDERAMDELICSHMPMIFRTASISARNPGVDINDLVQTATEGLLIAINRWSFEKADAGGARIAQQDADDADADPAVREGEGGELGAALEAPRFSRLATYAMWWMRILLTDCVIKQRCVINRAKHSKVRRALFNLPKVITKLNLQLPLAGADVARIAKYLDLGTHEVEEALVHLAGDVMLDEPVGDGSMLRGELMADDRAESEDGILSRLASADRWRSVCEALMELAPRDRFILITRYLLVPKWKLDRLSDTLQMSRERIRQIGVDGLKRIRQKIDYIEAARDRRRPDRPASVHPALIPLLRNAGSLDGGFGGTVSEPAAERSSAEADVAALIEMIERACDSSDPGALAAFFKEQHLAIGPTRVVNNNRPARISVNSNAECAQYAM